MGDKSKIQWTEATWNPVRGCSVVSPGCEQCYAMGVSARFSDKGQPYEGLARFSSKRRLPQWTGRVRLVPEHLADPLRWTKPRRVFVNSMSDLFHEGLTNEEIDRVVAVMAISEMHETRGGHVFQVLTKRAERLRRYASVDVDALRLRIARAAGQMMEDGDGWYDLLRFHMPWPLRRVWWGVSAEDQRRADERAPELLATPAAVRFVSYEPALGPIDFSPWLGGQHAQAGLRPDPKPTLSWVIVGGESGPRARPFDVAWARSVVKQCADAGVACFVKQLGRHPISDSDDDRRHCGDMMLPSPFEMIFDDKKGGTMCDWPEDLRVRQFPKT